MTQEHLKVRASLSPSLCAYVCREGKLTIMMILFKKRPEVMSNLSHDMNTHSLANELIHISHQKIYTQILIYTHAALHYCSAHHKVIGKFGKNSAKN